MTRFLAPIIAFTLLAASVAAADEAPLRTISTSGTSTVFVTPDLAVIRFEVHTFDADLEKAREKNDAACKDVLKIVQSMGVEPKDIQTDRLRAEPVYDYDSDFTQQKQMPAPHAKKLTGYTTGRSYVVRLGDLTKFESLTGTLLTRTDCTLGNFDFETGELRKHRDQARKMAIHAAKEKAVALAAELECKTGKARTISESSEMFYDNRFNAGNAQAHDEVDQPGGANETTPLGQIAVRATVHVTFDLE